MILGHDSLPRRPSISDKSCLSKRQTNSFPAQANEKVAKFKVQITQIHLVGSQASSYHDETLATFASMAGTT